MATRGRPRTINPPPAVALANMPEDIPDPVGKSVAPFVAPDLPADLEVDRYIEGEMLFDSLTNEFGGEGSQSTVTINKRNEQTRKFEWLERASAHDLNMEGIPYLAKYGPGDYLLLFYKEGERGVKKRFIVPISKAGAAREQAKTGFSGNPELAALAESVKHTQAAIAELARVIAQPKQESVADRLKEFLMIREAFGGGASQQPQQQQQNPFGMVRDVFDLVREIQPPGDGAEGIMKVADNFLTRFGPLVQKVIEQSAAQQPKPVLPPPANNAPAPASAPAPAGAPSAPVTVHATPDNPEGNEAMFQSMMLQYFLGTLISAAQQNADPVTYADMILDQVPGETLEAWINEPSLLDVLAKHDARVKNYPAWFNELRTAILEIKTERENPPDPDEPGS